ncbi:hypothetical protein M758_7G144300 [Ceratodon purpureus]|nr:hypothetical protein M758_7G144300 [Ceratodon purpureus]
MTERPSSSNAGEGQVVARVSVKDRLGPLPPQSASKRGRDRSVDRNHRRGRKFSKSAQGAEPNFQGGAKTGRVPVHERLGPLPPQAFKKNDLFQKRNRQQVWRHQGNFTQSNFKAAPASEEPEEQGAAALGDGENVENVKPPNVKYVKPPVPALPIVQPFNAEQHRQAWTWVRPATNTTAMEVDEST